MATLNQTHIQGLTILKLSGSLDNEGIEQVEGLFHEATSRPGAHVVVDLTGVDMVTTPALSLFIAAAHAVRGSGGAIAFAESPPPVRDVLQRLRLQSVLHTVPSLDEAIAQTRPS